MILHPVKASGWFKSNLSVDERGALVRSGIVPVNDKLLPYWNDRSKVLMFYGGRGGGKSEFIFQKLLNKCLNDRYFKCFYGRKTFASVRESCFDTLATMIETMGLGHMFSYSRADNSSMVVRCLLNGNKFVPFGADKAENLKSIKDPSHIFCEEFIGAKDGAEFTFDDFSELFPTLRTTKAQSQLILAFNTHKVYTDHWGIKVFFPEIYTGEDKIDVSIIQDIEVTKVFVNYPDNHFIDRDEYGKFLMLAAGGNQMLFEAMANGAWGYSENGNPWLHAFDRNKHVRPNIPLKKEHPVYLSFDFNNEPLTCTAWQFSPYIGKPESWITCIDEFVGNYKIEDICDRIKAAFPRSILHITGDRSGRNAFVGSRRTAYEMIAGYLGVSDRLIDTPHFNLEHWDSRMLCNSLFHTYPNLSISSKCTTLIKDCEIAKVDDRLNKGGGLFKDRGIYKMDVFDGMRYFFQTYFHEKVF